MGDSIESLDSRSRRLRSAAVVAGSVLDEQQSRRLIRYLALLERWNAVHNLSGLHTHDDLLVRLLFDSLPLASCLTRYAGERQLRILDVGSGSGFPAVVLAVAQPAWAVTAVDSIAKKVAFVRQAASECGITNLQVVLARAEELDVTIGFDVIVSKALGSLPDLVTKTERLLAGAGVWIAQKGRYPASEIDALAARFEVFHVEPVHVPELMEERCLIWIRRSQ